MVFEGSETTQALFDILRQAHTVNQALTRIARHSTGLRYEQVSVLCALDSVGGKATIGTLAQSVSRASHTVTALVDNLEAQAYVLRERSAPDDRRRVWIRLTERGANAVSVFQGTLEEILAAQELESLFPEMRPAWDMTVAALQEALQQDTRFARRQPPQT